MLLDITKNIRCPFLKGMPNHIVKGHRAHLQCHLEAPHARSLVHRQEAHPPQTRQPSLQAHDAYAHLLSKDTRRAR